MPGILSPICLRKGWDDLGKMGLRVTTTYAIYAAITLVLFQGSAAAATHKVKAGDTLWSVARKHHTTPKAIARANGISENAILALGKSLTIPDGKPAPKRTAPSRNWTRTTRPAKTASAEVHTTCAGAHLRAGASTTARKVAKLPQGTTLTYISRKGNWAKVALSNGVRGYVYRPLLGHGPGASREAAASPHRHEPDAAGTEPDLIRTALACRGVRYSRGGTSRGGFDCSGFTRYVFAKYGVALPHSSAAQARLGTPVNKSDLKAGDLVFFQTYRRGISHVGIYIGNNNFVHAATYGRGVRVDSLSSGYYASRYRGARRVK